MRRGHTLSFLLTAFVICFCNSAQAQSGAKELFMGIDGTSTQLAAKSEPGPAKPVAKPKVLGVQTTIYQLFEDGGVKAVSPSTLFKAGDRIRLGFNANRGGYLYVLNVGSSGRTSTIFPTSAQDNNQVRPGLVYQVPQQTGKSIKFDSTPGEEVLLVVLSETKIQEVAYGGQNLAFSTPGNPLPADRVPTVQLAMADAVGSKDLFVEDDGVFQTVVFNPASSAAAQSKPLVTTIKLKHR